MTLAGIMSSRKGISILSNQKRRRNYIMGKQVLVDLSHPFGRGNPLWPSNGDFHIDRVQHMPMHYRLLQTFNDFHMHNSTHADSSHVIPNPRTPMSSRAGELMLMAKRSGLGHPQKHWELITVADIEKCGGQSGGRRIVEKGGSPSVAPPSFFQITRVFLWLARQICAKSCFKQTTKENPWNRCGSRDIFCCGEGFEPSTSGL
ncbi:MAG: hypothetical protein ACLU9S_23680 [Oscillospiraceae bacterium]